MNTDSSGDEYNESRYTEEIIQHNGEDIITYNYDLKMELEEVFRLNHIEDMQYIYEQIRDYLQKNNEKAPTLQQFIDFCLRNSYVEEISYINSKDIHDQKN